MKTILVYLIIYIFFIISYTSSIKNKRLFMFDVIYLKIVCFLFNFISYSILSKQLVQYKNFLSFCSLKH